MIAVHDGLGSARELERAFWKALRPDPMMTVAEWAAMHRHLPRSTSGEPGLWRNDRTPYLVEIMEALSPSSAIETVVFVAGSQIGKTEVGNNFLGYIVDQAPGPTLMVLPTEGVAESISKERLGPLFGESTTLRGKVRDPKKKDSGNTLLRKEFPGGFLKLVSADSSAQLRSTPARYIFGDEVDAYPASSGNEGDPVTLVTRGQTTFRRRKALWTSTPTLEGHSRIWRLYEQTDQRRYLVPCPHCDHFQELVWGQLKFDSSARNARLRQSVNYQCVACGFAIYESAKTKMLARGRWEATAEGSDEKARGYHLNTLYSPWFEWHKMAQLWIEAQTDLQQLKAFVNIRLAQCWAEKGEKPDWRRLFERRESWPAATCPMGVTFLTAAVDVQGDRLEYEVVGWGPNRERWGIEYGALGGDPSQPDVWHELWAKLDRPFQHEAGVTLLVRRVAVDSGFLATEVYKACRKRPRTTLVVKGEDALRQVIRPPVHATAKTKAGRSKAMVYGVGSSLVKEELYHALRQDRPLEGEAMPAGYCHFPDTYPPEFFKQITGEELVTKKNRRGFPVREWVKTHERNEALDLAVYARAAASDVGLDRWTPEQWARERTDSGLPPSGGVGQPARTKKLRRKVRSGGRFDRWRS